MGGEEEAARWCLPGTGPLKPQVPGHSVHLQGPTCRAPRGCKRAPPGFSGPDAAQKCLLQETCVPPYPQAALRQGLAQPGRTLSDQRGEGTIWALEASGPNVYLSTAWCQSAACPLPAQQPHRPVPRLPAQVQGEQSGGLRMGEGPRSAQPGTARGRWPGPGRQGTTQVLGRPGSTTDQLCPSNDPYDLLPGPWFPSSNGDRPCPPQPPQPAEMTKTPFIKQAP